MATLRLTQDFKEFLSLLNSSGIEYLLIGGYAVGLYGYVRPTKDMDVWVATDPTNVDRLRAALQAFGFRPGSLPVPLFERNTSAVCNDPCFRRIYTVVAAWVNRVFGLKTAIVANG